MVQVMVQVMAQEIIQVATEMITARVVIMHQARVRIMVRDKAPGITQVEVPAPIPGMAMTGRIPRPRVGPRANACRSHIAARNMSLMIGAATT